MVKPLVSNDPTPPKDVRFSHFGVLDDGQRSKSATITSITINVVIVLLMLILGAVVKTSPEMQKKLIALTLQPKPPAPKPIPKPVPPPPKPLPEIPKIKLEPPKIEIPKPVLEKVPEIKPLPVPVPKPVVLATPAPKLVNPPPAPKVVNLSAPAKAASIANNDAHPSPVRMGNPEIKALTTSPVAATPVNLGGGMHGMPPGNTGNGPRATAVNFGNGAPAGTDLRGKSVAAVPVKGLSTGVVGGTGTGANGPKQVNMGVKPIAPLATAAVVHTATLAKPPVVTYQPAAQYTAEASALHLQGEAVVSVVFRANGTIDVVGVVRGLGHGLDESALTVARGIRFKPAVDSNGQPTDFPTKIIVRFVSNS
jgi:protein TonB